MVTKKRKAAPRRRRTYAARRAAPRRRAKSGTQYIPSAMATVGLVLANKDILARVATKVSSDGLKAIPNLVIGSGNDYKWLRQQIVAPKQLVNDAAYIAGGYVAGEIVKKYAPGVIKRPLGKLAKKIPKVI